MSREALAGGGVFSSKLSKMDSLRTAAQPSILEFKQCCRLHSGASILHIMLPLSYLFTIDFLYLKGRKTDKKRNLPLLLFRKNPQQPGLDSANNRNGELWPSLPCG